MISIFRIYIFFLSFKKKKKRKKEKKKKETRREMCLSKGKSRSYQDFRFSLEKARKWIPRFHLLSTILLQISHYFILLSYW